MNKIKKIGLVTWMGRNNYGTILQCYALQQKLRLLGYHVLLLPKHSHSISLKKLLKHLLSSLGLELYLRNLIGKKLNRKQIFKQENYHSVKTLTLHQYKKKLRGIDCFLTGSDQIWNTYYKYNPFFFLDFVEKGKRVAYASSIGTQRVNPQYAEQVKKHLLKFQHIGVREASAVKVLNMLTGRNDIVQVLDPTFLLTPSEWYDMSSKAEINATIPPKFILCYLIGNNSNYNNQIQILRTVSGIEDVFIIPSAESNGVKYDNTKQLTNLGPREFVWLIQHSSLVCTDSFHATALSINHSKDFVEFLRFDDGDQKSQNSRIYDILNHYGLSDRIYSSHSRNWAKPLDYNPVQEILAKDRAFSLNYLINSIEN